MGVTINKKVNNNRTTALEWTTAYANEGGGGGGLNAFYWYQIFALDSAVAEVQEMFSSHGGLYSFTFLLYLVLIKLLFVSLPRCNPHIIKIEITTSKLYQLYLSIHLSITLYILSNVVYPYYFELPYLSMNYHASIFFYQFTYVIQLCL